MNMLFNNTIWYYFAPFLYMYLSYFWLLTKNRDIAIEGAEGGAEGAEGIAAPEGGE